MMFELRSYLDVRRKRVNDGLEACVENRSSTELTHAMRHSLMAGGKRLRPVLCIAGAEVVGGRLEEVLPIACAIEMIHTYSLIHDDLPAMDDDVLRRGVPTCHVVFGEATAILAGDALLTLAFEVLSTFSGADAPKMLRIIHIISDAAGYRGMVEGQMRDMDFEGIDLNLESLQELHALKTGRLIEASLISGAVFAGANSEQLEHLKAYAENIGLAFQITDDILNVEGDPALMGKATGTDGLRKKTTYPSLLGIDQSKEYAARLVENAIDALTVFNEKADPLRAIAAYIIDRKR